MISIKGVGEFFSLDIGTNSIRAVQLAKNNDGSWNLVGLGYSPVDPQLVANDSDEGRRRLSEVVTTALGQSDIRIRSVKNVAISLSSQKTFTTVIEVPMQDEKEFHRTIKYQLDQYIPMAIDEAKVDYASLGQSVVNPEMQEVLLASTAKNYSESKMEFVEDMGLNVIAAEPESLAMTRALLPKQQTGAHAIVDFGEHYTDLSVVYNGAPRLVRTIPVGLSSLIKSAVQNLNIKEDQARQFILKFGLAQDKLEGQVFHAIEITLENFVQEIVKSIKFFATKYPDVAVEGITLAGYAGAVPQLNEYVSAKTGIISHSGNPFQDVVIPAKYRDLIDAHGVEFSVAVGLAKRTGDK